VVHPRKLIVLNRTISHYFAKFMTSIKDLDLAEVRENYVIASGLDRYLAKNDLQMKELCKVFFYFFNKKKQGWKKWRCLVHFVLRLLNLIL
jgi:hypothetical protein